MLNKRHTSARQLHIQKRTGFWVKPTGPQETMSDLIWLPGSPGTWRSHPAGTEDVSRVGKTWVPSQVKGWSAPPGRWLAVGILVCPEAVASSDTSRVSPDPRRLQAVGGMRCAVMSAAAQVSGHPEAGLGVWQEVGGWQQLGVGGLPSG